MADWYATLFSPGGFLLLRKRVAARFGMQLYYSLTTGVTNSPLLAFLVLAGHGPSRAICSRSGADLQAWPAAAGAPGHRGNKLPTPGVPGARWPRSKPCVRSGFIVCEFIAPDGERVEQHFLPSELEKGVLKVGGILLAEL